MEQFKLRHKDNIVIEIDDEFVIEVDHSNWTVCRYHEIHRGKNKGQWKWDEVAYCHDLPAALKCIARHKRPENVPTSSISAYLSWLDTILASMTKAVLEQDRALLEAVKKNKVLVSPYTR